MSTTQATSLDPNSYPLFAGTDAATASKDLGRNDFVKLLVAQLEHQNPLEPAKDTEFIAQLATFSSLEQLTDLNKRMESLTSGQQQLINSQALALVGNDVLADTGGKFKLHASGAESITYGVGDGTQSVSIEIYDESGKLVRTVEQDATAGVHSFKWDGKDGDGADAKTMPAGNYSYAIKAVDSTGTKVALSGLVQLRVDGIHVGPDGVALLSGDRVISFADIAEIREPSAPTGD